jgi:hypothetical protein
MPYSYAFIIADKASGFDSFDVRFSVSSKWRMSLKGSWLSSNLMQF